MPSFIPPVIQPAPAPQPAPQPLGQTSGPPEATMGARIGGFAVDLLVAFSILLVLSIISSNLGLVVALAYLVTRDCLPFLDGQSIGKKALRTRAVTESGASLSGNWNNGLLRNLTMIPPFTLVELIVLSSRQDQAKIRRLGDEWFQTKVISAEPATPPAA
jgi:uncharacterized RDD family membrane protein YckC